MNLLKEQRSIAVITILSGLLALGCIMAIFIAVNFNADAIADPLLALSQPGTNITAVRWSMILDMFGFYLLLLPVIYLLHDWMKQRSAWAGMISFCGIAYVLIGGIGASVLAVVWPNIMTAYPAATGTEQQILKGNFVMINDMVYSGMWNLLEMFLAAAWWTFTGYQLLKSKFSFIGWSGIITGISCMADALSGMLQIGWLHELALNLYMLFAITWAIAMGLFLLKKPLKHHIITKN